VNDPLPVRGFKGFGDLLRNQQRFVQWNRATRNALRQILALDELHHERLDAVGVFEPVDRGDLRVIQGGEDFGFALKTRQSIAITRDRGRQELDRDLPLQRRVRRPIHLPHSAFTDLGSDGVDAEPRAGSEGQVLRII
jgi:hypothetical protein